MERRGSGRARITVFVVWIAVIRVAIVRATIVGIAVVRVGIRIIGVAGDWEKPGARNGGDK